MRTCTICQHPERTSIETALAGGTPYRDIALQFGVGHMAVQRHAASHIQEAVKQAQEAKEEAQSLNVVRQLQVINNTTLNILKEARDAKQNSLALQAIDRVMKQLELQAKLLGDLDERTQMNILLTPEWHAIRSTLLTSLAPFPDARIAVATALIGLEGGNHHDHLN